MTDSPLTSILQKLKKDKKTKRCPIFKLKKVKRKQYENKMKSSIKSILIFFLKIKRRRALYKFRKSPIQADNLHNKRESDMYVPDQIEDEAVALIHRPTYSNNLSQIKHDEDCVRVE